jgi:arylsulfatase A-like enzyme
MRRLKSTWLADNTLIVITSDHGEEFGEHGGTGHGRTLHQEVLRVPLVIAAPGLLAPARVTTPASLLDVAPTVLELLGLEPVTTHRGVSLVARARAAASGAASDPADAARPLFAEVDRNDHGHVQQVAVRRSGATAITDLANGGVTRCYAAEDRAELAPTDDCPELRALIDLHRSATLPVGTAAPKEVTDPELIEKMRALGYIE